MTELFSEPDCYAERSVAREGCRDGELRRSFGGNLSHCGGECHIQNIPRLKEQIVGISLDRFSFCKCVNICFCFFLFDFSPRQQISLLQLESPHVCTLFPTFLNA